MNVKTGATVNEAFREEHVLETATAYLVQAYGENAWARIQSSLSDLQVSQYSIDSTSASLLTQ